MRTWLPAFATLPSRTAPTPSTLPIARMSSLLPLKANEEVRAATCNPDTFDSAVIRSSVMPSLKYSFSGSELMFTNGNTAIVFCGGVGTGASAATWTSGTADAGGTLSREFSHHASTAIARPTRVNITPARDLDLCFVATCDAWAGCAGVAFSLAAGAAKEATPSSPAS